MAWSKVQKTCFSSAGEGGLHNDEAKLHHELLAGCSLYWWHRRRFDCRRCPHPSMQENTACQGSGRQDAMPSLLSPSRRAPQPPQVCKWLLMMLLACVWSLADRQAAPCSLAMAQAQRPTRPHQPVAPSHPANADQAVQPIRWYHKKRVQDRPAGRGRAAACAKGGGGCCKHVQGPPHQRR